MYGTCNAISAAHNARQVVASAGYTCLLDTLQLLLLLLLFLLVMTQGMNMYALFCSFLLDSNVQLWSQLLASL